MTDLDSKYSVITRHYYKLGLRADDACKKINEVEGDNSIDLDAVNDFYDQFRTQGIAICTQQVKSQKQTTPTGKVLKRKSTIMSETGSFDDVEPISKRLRSTKKSESPVSVKSEPISKRLPSKYEPVAVEPTAIENEPIAKRLRSRQKSESPVSVENEPISKRLRSTKKSESPVSVEQETISKRLSSKDKPVVDRIVIKRAVKKKPVSVSVDSIPMTRARSVENKSISKRSQSKDKPVVEKSVDDRQDKKIGNATASQESRDVPVVRSPYLLRSKRLRLELDTSTSSSNDATSTASNTQFKKLVPKERHEAKNVEVKESPKRKDSPLAIELNDSVALNNGEDQQVEFNVNVQSMKDASWTDLADFAERLASLI